MSELSKSTDLRSEEISDNFGDAVSISSAELDAIEAFLMSQLQAIMDLKEGDQFSSVAVRTDSEAPQTSAPV